MIALLSRFLNGDILRLDLHRGFIAASVSCCQVVPPPCKDMRVQFWQRVELRSGSRLLASVPGFFLRTICIHLQLDLLLLLVIAPAEDNLADVFPLHISRRILLCAIFAPIRWALATEWTGGDRADPFIFIA